MRLIFILTSENKILTLKTYIGREGGRKGRKEREKGRKGGRKEGGKFKSLP